MKTPAEIIKLNCELKKQIRALKQEMLGSIKTILREHDDEFLYDYEEDVLDYVLITSCEYCSYGAYVKGLYYNEELDEIGIYCESELNDEDESIETLNYEDITRIYETLIKKTKG